MPWARRSRGAGTAKVAGRCYRGTWHWGGNPHIRAVPVPALLCCCGHCRILWPVETLGQNLNLSGRYSPGAGVLLFPLSGRQPLTQAVARPSSSICSSCLLYMAVDTDEALTRLGIYCAITTPRQHLRLAVTGFLDITATGYLGSIEEHFLPADKCSIACIDLPSRSRGKSSSVSECIPFQSCSMHLSDLPRAHNAHTSSLS